MPDKSFERTVQFRHIPLASGSAVWLPLILVELIRSDGSRVQLPLLFDTGASVTTLRQDLYHLLDVSSWDSGTPVQTDTAGGSAPVTVYRYKAQLEVFGKVIDCPVHLAELPPNPLYVGLFGRDAIFEHFGFGFWESSHELLVTASP